tara:strand:- start:14149 stop:14940 length:792 start_codon:yes stop_codon:yes gene_type:complete
MFITTKAEFQWDGEKYVEIHTEGFEYEGDLELAAMDDSGSSSGAGVGAGAGTGSSSPSGGFPTLYDLTTRDVASIMLDMGFTQEEVDQYSGYVPEFDPWKAGYAAEEAEVGLQRLNIEEEGIGLQRQLTEDLFGISQESLQKQMFGAASSVEQNLYGAFQQQSSIAGAGLGQRQNISDRGRSQAMAQYGSQMDTLGLQSLEQSAKYGAQMGEFDNQLAMLETDRAMVDIGLRKDIESEQRQYEDDFWDFMTFLKTNFDVGFDD